MPTTEPMIMPAMAPPEVQEQEGVSVVSVVDWRGWRRGCDEEVEEEVVKDRGSF